jgi:hypothetical protein
MFFRIPTLKIPADSSSYDLLRNALAQYNVALGDDNGQRQLQSLIMDDIDFVEAIELVERALKVKLDRRALTASTTITDVIAMFDAARNSGPR